MCKLLRITVLVSLEMFTLISLSFSPEPAHAQARYQQNPKIRKGRAREAMFKAMELNAQVEMMLIQNSLETAKMVQMLRDSYGFQVTAIAQIEGVYREASFKDPTLEQGIKQMYDVGKPNTAEARGAIERGDFAAALANLKTAKVAHQRFLTLTY